MATIIPFPEPEIATLRPWDWLRRMADQLEKEGDVTDVLMTLVLVNVVDQAYRLRAERYSATRLEAVGMLTTAAHDFNSL